MIKNILSSFILVFLINYSYSQSGSKAETKVDWSRIADSLQSTTTQVYLSSDRKYFVQDNLGNTKFNYWWNAHGLDVLVDSYIRTRDKSLVDKMKSLLAGIKDTNGGTFYNDFYDDMEWLALASLRAFEATEDRAFLEVTHLLWKDIQTAANDIQGGGFAWRKSQTYYKNTPANAPAIILASRLYQLNQNEAELKIAKDLYSWLNMTLVDSNSGFVKDGINREQDGKIDPWRLTYNQGVYIGAGLELFRITKDKKYLRDAVKTSDFVINDPEFAPNGILKSEGDGDGGLFKGILIRYLTLLAKDKHVPRNKRETYKAFIRHNAQTMIQKGIRRPQMLVGTVWEKQPEGKTDYSTQLSGIMLVEAMSALK